MILKYAIWGVLILSSLMLVLIVFRSRGGGRLVASLGLNVVVAAFLLIYIESIECVYTSRTAY